MNSKYILILLTIIFSIIMLYVTIGFYKKLKKNMVIESIGIYICYLVFLYFEFNGTLKVNYFIVFLALLATVGHILIGKYFSIYYKSISYDRYLHAFGAIAFSLFTYSIIKSLTGNMAFPKEFPKLYTAIFVTCIGISLGTIFELVEFANDCVSSLKCQHGLKDTNMDLLANLIGSILGGIASIYTFF